VASGKNASMLPRLKKGCGKVGSLGGFMGDFVTTGCLLA